MGHYETDTYIIKDMDDNAFLVPVHGAPPREEQIPEVSVHHASASDLDEDTLSKLEAYEDREVEDLLGRAIPWTVMFEFPVHMDRGNDHHPTQFYGDATTMMQ